MVKKLNDQLNVAEEILATERSLEQVNNKIFSNSEILWFLSNLFGMLTKKRLNFLSKYLFLSESDACRITFYELQDSWWEIETIPTLQFKKKKKTAFTGETGQDGLSLPLSGLWWQRVWSWYPPHFSKDYPHEWCTASETMRWLKRFLLPPLKQQCKYILAVILKHKLRNVSYRNWH